MPLTELIIDGFKSFAEKTKIKFDTGITGIVGPNGSGKSNITEAIRWVMGESSAKSLRGSNMKDVIFAGSEFRQPANHAEVSLIFNNKKHELNFKEDQVVITRRILRSGDNEYLINKKSVRQRDVRALFLDSGISQDSLAIISQGRVDQILNSRPEERRSLFEEAAGVLHFKRQKEEAKVQLEQTTDNLVRINDLVKELEQRIEPLHEQSSLAKEYQFQKKGLDRELKTLLAFEIQDLDNQKEKEQEKADENQTLLSKLDREVKDSQAAVANKRKEYQTLNSQRDKVQNDLLSLTKKLSEINTNLQVAVQSKQYSAATKKEYQFELGDLKKQLLAIENDRMDLLEKEKNLKSEQEKLNDKRTELCAQLKEDPEQLNRKLEQLRSAYIQLLQDQTSNNNEIVYLNSELKKLSDNSQFQTENVVEELRTETTELKRLKSEGKSLKENCQIEEQKIADLTNEQKISQKNLSSLQESLSTKKQRFSQLNARYDALENIRKRHEGYFYGVKNVLNNLSAYPGVIGAVGELVTFPVKYEAAMATALGNGVQDLVTKSKLDARDAINKLKENHAGRATFLPLDGLREYTIPTSTINTISSFSGFQGIASEIVKSLPNQDIAPAINYLLGNTIIVDTISNAMKIRQRISRYRIVTLDGDVISPGGSMTGGVRNQKSNSPLQTTAELSQLRQNINDLKAKIKNEQSQLADAVSKNEILTQQLNEMTSKFQNLKQELGEAALSYQNQEKEVNRLKAANSLFEQQKKERNQEITETKNKIKSAEKKKKELQEKILQQKQDISELQLRIKNFSELNQEVQEKLSELDPQIAVYANKLENISKQKSDKKNESKQHQNQINTLSQKLKELDENDALGDEKKMNFERENKEGIAKKKNLQEQLNTLSSKLGQYDAKINQLDQVASRNYELRKDAAAEQKDFSVKIAQLNSQIDQRLDTLNTEYSLTYEAALNQAETENNETNRTQLQKNVKLHRMSIADIGPVNLKSIEEYESVKKRYDFLNAQQNDLLKGRDNLEKSMSELDQEVCSRFSKTFTEVAHSFTELFPVVFGGGSAKLVLTNPEDLLNTGVEIIAQPPGKKLQKLSLLSGGERALTAITLLFAMLKVKPVPFCVLDEVEAALDDANVTRFAHFLEEYDMHTQFIVITHRRGTMEKADQLYGVVMQESGVSQVLSVSLKELKNEVK